MSIPLSIWPSPEVRALARRRAPHLPFPLEEEHHAVFSLGRHCLFHAVRALGLEAGDELLLPGFNHGSEVEALTRSGIECRFYDVDERLEPDDARLEAMLGSRVRGLYLIHFLGFAQDMVRWRRWCDERNLLLIEDVAQGWLGSSGGTPLGSLGDAAIYCLYKTYGMPDGGAVVAGRPIARPRRAGAWGPGQVLRKQASRWRSRDLRDIRGPDVHLEPGPMRAFELGDPYVGPSKLTQRLLPRVVPEQVAELRRDHYAFLLERLSGAVPSPFDRPPAAEVPFAFPIEVSDRQRLVERLRSSGIRADAFWARAHPKVAKQDLPNSNGRRARTATLPVHQHLSRRDLNRIVTVTRSLLEDTG